MQGPSDMKIYNSSSDVLTGTFQLIVIIYYYYSHLLVWQMLPETHKNAIFTTLLPALDISTAYILTLV